MLLREGELNLRDVRPDFKNFNAKEFVCYPETSGELLKDHNLE